MSYNNENILNYDLKDEILTPLMIKRLLDCFEVNILESCVVENMKFELADLGVIYKDKAPVCVNDIWYTYDYLGIKNNPVKGEIGCQDINLYGSEGVAVMDNLETYKLYTDYFGQTNINCCECMDKIKFIETKLQFEIKNLVITLQGTIGNEPFIGRYTYSGSIV